MGLQFSPTASEFFRELPLFDKLALRDLFDDMRAGRVPVEDYGEITEDGSVISVIIFERFAISYSVDEELDIVLISEIQEAGL